MATMASVVPMPLYCGLVLEASKMARLACSTQRPMAWASSRAVVALGAARALSHCTREEHTREVAMPEATSPAL